MVPTRLAFVAALFAISALPAVAQPYVSPVARPYAMRPFPAIGYSALRVTGFQFGYSYGFGTDYYSGYYYRPTSNYGYYYLGNYYPDTASVTLRTPLSPPPPVVQPLPNLTAPSAGSPGYTYPELINPSSNPTIRPKK